MKRTAALALCLCVSLTAAGQELEQWITRAIMAGFTVQTFLHIIEAADYTDPTTRTFALASVSHHGAYTIDQVCDVFDAIAPVWIYVSDPSSTEYVAAASESIAAGLRGDCEDYAVAMAACVRAIGGAAIVSLEVSAVGNHAVPLLFLGSDARHATRLYIHVAKRYHGSVVVPTVLFDLPGYWLNLDATAWHPGGPPLIAASEIDFRIPVPILSLFDFISDTLPFPSL